MYSCSAESYHPPRSSAAPASTGSESPPSPEYPRHTSADTTQTYAPSPSRASEDSQPLSSLPRSPANSLAHSAHAEPHPAAALAGSPRAPTPDPVPAPLPVDSGHHRYDQTESPQNRPASPSPASNPNAPRKYKCGCSARQ